VVVLEPAEFEEIEKDKKMINAMKGELKRIKDDQENGS